MKTFLKLKKSLLLLILASILAPITTKITLSQSSTIIAQNNSNIAPIFRPVLSQIQEQLRGNEVIRLPSSLYVFENRNLHADATGEDSFTFGRDGNTLSIGLKYESRCGQYNIRCENGGTITTAFSEVPLSQMFAYYNMAETSQAPITIKEGIRGIYHYTPYTNILSGPRLEIAWHQDGQTYRIFLPEGNEYYGEIGVSYNSKKEALINMARSMANQPPIRSSSSQSNQSTPTPLTSQTRLTLRGFGPVQIGMTIAQAQQVTGQRFNQISSGGEPSCLYYQTNAVEKVSFMVTEGRISRIDVDNPNITTPSGARIGFTERQIYELYPGYIRSEPHAYITAGHYLYFVPRDAEDQNYRLIFETNGNQVMRMRSGKLPEVGWIEGCV
jgi:hypothetical protein